MRWSLAIRMALCAPNVRCFMMFLCDVVSHISVQGVMLMFVSHRISISSWLAHSSNRHFLLASMPHTPCGAWNKQCGVVNSCMPRWRSKTCLKKQTRTIKHKTNNKPSVTPGIAWRRCHQRLSSNRCGQARLTADSGKCMHYPPIELITLPAWLCSAMCEET